MLSISDVFFREIIPLHTIHSKFIPHLLESVNKYLTGEEKLDTENKTGTFETVKCEKKVLPNEPSWSWLFHCSVNVWMWFRSKKVVDLGFLGHFFLLWKKNPIFSLQIIFQYKLITIISKIIGCPMKIVCHYRQFWSKLSFNQLTWRLILDKHRFQSSTWVSFLPLLIKELWLN